MTMQEAINHAKEVAEEKYKEGFLCYANSGDVENDKKNDECVKCAKEHEQLAEWLEELQQYRSIGTVEECWEARERQRGRKVNNRKLLRDFNKTPYSVRGDCPNCGSVGLLSMNTDYCDTCGQKLDWSDTP